MAQNQLELVDGGEITSAQLSRNMPDVTIFVNTGNVLHFTSYSRRRWSLVPVAVGEAYEAVRKAATDEDRVAAAAQLVESLGVVIHDATDSQVSKEPTDA